MAQRRKTRKAQQDVLVDIVEVREQAESFYEKNQKILLGIGAGLLLLVGGYFGYKYLYQMPRNKEAAEQMFQAELQFQRDSFELALINPGGGYSGFLDIIDNYKGTAVANLAHYYAGICYLQLGNFQAAISFLEDFRPGGKVTPIMKYGAMGDAYSEMEQWDRAITSYKKAAQAADNEFLTPYYMKKLGLLYEKQEKHRDALETYTSIKAKYPRSQEASNIEKFTSRARSAL